VSAHLRVRVALSHLEMLWDIIFWNSFHKPSHFCEYINM